MGFTAAVPAARRVPATRVSTITMWSNPDSPLLHGAAAIWRTRSAFAPYVELGLHTPASRARAILGRSLTNPFSTTVLAACSSSLAPPSVSSRSPRTPPCRCACPALRRPSSSCSSRSSARRSSRRARASRSRCSSRRAGRRRTSRPAARWRWSRCARWPPARQPATHAAPAPLTPLAAPLSLHQRVPRRLPPALHRDASTRCFKTPHTPSASAGGGPQQGRA